MSESFQDTGANPITVLIADAHPIVCRGIRKVLEDDPALRVIGEATTVSEAISYIGATRPNVVVMENYFGDEYSLSRLPDLTAACTASRIVIFAETAGEMEMENAASFGVHSFVAKSQSTDDLLTAVRKAAEAVSIQ